ncbi:MAG: signal peptidase I [Clostridiales bacterium]|nr:signal peptidase I [Clostridiales bacterium]
MQPTIAMSSELICTIPEHSHSDSCYSSKLSCGMEESEEHVFQIKGTSMEPTMNDGDIVVAVKTTSFKQGEVVGFYFNNKLLLKRVIATQGDWVEIDEDGNVTVNGTLLYEPYVTEKSLGISDIQYPYQVPDNSVFVLGDHRAESVDSRSSMIGCIAADEIVGRVIFKVWPFRDMGPVD